MSLRVVFDTNTVISALLFRGRLDWLRKVWFEGLVITLANKATVQELYHALSYPKFVLSEEDREELLGDYLPFIELVNMPSRLPGLPKCRDCNDQKFIELAHVAKANVLVTGDKDLLVLSAKAEFKICGPAVLQAMLGLTAQS